MPTHHPKPPRRWRWNYRTDPVEASRLIAGARGNLERVHKQAQRLLAHSTPATIEMLATHVAKMRDQLRVLQETTREIRTAMMSHDNSDSVDPLDGMDRALDEFDRAEGVIDSASQTIKLIEERQEKARMESKDRVYEEITRMRDQYRAIEDMTPEARAKIEALIDELEAQHLLEKLDPFGDFHKFSNLQRACDRIAGISREQRLEMTIASLKRGGR